jgi:hypothetical protein
MSQKMVHFVTIAVRTTNPTIYYNVAADAVMNIELQGVSIHSEIACSSQITRNEKI